MWEGSIISAAKTAKPDVLCVELDERNLDHRDVAVIVIVFSAAQFVALKRWTSAKLRLASSNYPGVRLILMAVGLADDPVGPEDGHNLLRTGGYKIDQGRFQICPTEDEFQLNLSSHIRVAIEVGAMQARVDEMYSSSAGDVENEA